MLYVSGIRYDSTTRVLTVDRLSPSRTRRVVVQYRDVAPHEVARLEAARPHWGRVLDRELAPAHAARRVGETDWAPPRAGDVPG